MPGRKATSFDPHMNGGLQLGFPLDEEHSEPPRTSPARLTTVVCLKGRQGDPTLDDVLYVGRPMFQGGWRLHGHPLANPFKVGRDGTPEQVVEKYGSWLDAHRQLLERELPKLRGRRLGCWCAEGQPCHARLLAALANREAIPKTAPQVPHDAQAVNRR